MAKLLKFKTEAKEALLRGVATVAEAVGSTLGPKGNNVGIDRQWGSPTVVHDGVTVAKEIDLVDKFENMGAQMVKEAALRTNDEAGDGTTTATVVAHAIAQESYKNIVAGNNAMILRKGIEKAHSAMQTALDAMAIPINTLEESKQVAIISAQDESIGRMVATAIDRMGADGVITVEESGTTETTVEYKEGMEFDRGWVSPYFVTSPELMETNIDNPYILITDKKLDDAKDFLTFINKFALDSTKDSSGLVVVSDEISSLILQTLIVNKLKGNQTLQNILAVHAPKYGDQRKSFLEDVATVTGGTFISSDTGMKLESVELSMLGRASRVTSTKDSTIIVDGRGIKKGIEDRISSLKNTMAKIESEFEKERLQERIAKLSSGIAIINIGANSEIEMREKKERVIDAISATKAARSEGIVPGGETALIRAALELDKIEATDEEKVGIKLVKKAIEQPFRKLMSNAGYDEGEMLAELKGHLDKKSMGIDVIDGKVKDLVKAGVIDPVRVTKSALKNAVSVAIMVMTTDTLITDEPEKDDQ
jgi:chaperonin GroEL